MKRRPAENHSRMLRIWIAILAVAAILTAGCGKKGPPVPPGAETAPPVADLTGEREGNRVRLTWSVPRPEKPGEGMPTRFFVYRNRTAEDGVACPGCPLVFERIADLPAEPCEAGGQPCPAMAYVESLEPGYRYRFRIRSVSAEGIAAVDSNTVEIAY
jgi:predicted small lipoprotein YifL